MEEIGESSLATKPSTSSSSYKTSLPLMDTSNQEDGMIEYSTRKSVFI
jgi:hypothetical protein